MYYIAPPEAIITDRGMFELLPKNQRNALRVRRDSEASGTLYEEFTMLAETRLAQNTSNYINIA